MNKWIYTYMLILRVFNTKLSLDEYNAHTWGEPKSTNARFSATRVLSIMVNMCCHPKSRNKRFNS